MSQLATVPVCCGWFGADDEDVGDGVEVTRDEEVALGNDVEVVRDVEDVVGNTVELVRVEELEALEDVEPDETEPRTQQF